MTTLAATCVPNALDLFGQSKMVDEPRQENLETLWKKEKSQQRKFSLPFALFARQVLHT